MRISKDYLKNSKIIARMLNDSPMDVKAYWFFTTKTIPDATLLTMLNTSKHEVALHITNYPFKEKKNLETKTGRTIKYFTIHGTARLIMRILWRRWKTKTPIVPKNFPLKSFHQFPTLSLDVLSYNNTLCKTIENTRKSISEKKILEIHPDWLFQKGTFNHRGPFYSVLRKILKVDQELENLVQQRRFFAKIGHLSKEYEQNVVPTDLLINKLNERNLDIFTFIERSWCHKFLKIPKNWIQTKDNIAMLHLENYEDWWKKIGKKTRNMIRKAKKSGLVTNISQPNEKLAEGIRKIYNETPIRQGRHFLHYGLTLKTVTRRISSSKNSIFVGSYFEDELVGFIQLIIGDKIVIISQILSKVAHWDKAVNNSLIATTIKICSNKNVKWIMYGRMGNHPSLDNFKNNNGFMKYTIPRYYIILTKKGKIISKFKLQKNIKDLLPYQIKNFFIPVYNWVNRTRTNIQQ